MPAESRDLTNTVVAITGASSGIGAASARLLLEAGAKVVVQARHRDRLDALATKFGAENVLVVTGDVQDPASATDLVARPSSTSVRWTASWSTRASACTAESSTPPTTTCVE